MQHLNTAITIIIRRTAAFVILFLMSAAVFCASGESIEFATASSIPPHVVAAFAKFQSSKKFEFSAHIHPFYLQGDFNGDGKPDTAVLIKHKVTGKIGIAIVHGGSSTVTVLGADQSFGNGGDNFSWLDAWYTQAKGKVSKGAEGGAPPKLIGDAIMVIKTESASALIYWSGDEYRWYQQGD
jgi:hypothetical protein